MPKQKHHAYRPMLDGFRERFLGQSYLGLGGLHRDAPDARDYPASRALTVGAAPAASLPPAVDLRAGFPPAQDQGPFQSCSAHAFTAAMQFLLRQQAPGPLDLPGAGTFAEGYSRMFLWYKTREAEQHAALDAPCSLRDALQVLTDQGVCLESLWPYDRDLGQAPDPAAVQDAAQRKVALYLRCADLGEVKASLAAGYPVVFGFTLFPSAMSNDGNLTQPAPGDGAEGGHAVVAVGYDDATQRVTFRNSWGPLWGSQAGYGTLPYAYFTQGLAWDYWSLRIEALPDLQAAYEAWEVQVAQDTLARAQVVLARAQAAQQAWQASHPGGA